MTGLFSLREQEIFKTLKQLKDFNFVIIGGYAVNSYALPRFSVDCDIVINKKEIHEIQKILLSIGYVDKNIPKEIPYSGSFSRYEKKLSNDFMVSMDVLIDKVTDRNTGAEFNSEWIFKNSEKRKLIGKTITENLQVKIVNIDALIAMKIISCRKTDIRDIFMMLPNSKDKEWIKSEVSSRTDFKERITKIINYVNSKQFKDGLSGIYGYFEIKVFEKHRKEINKLGENSIFT